MKGQPGSNKMIKKIATYCFVIAAVSLTSCIEPFSIDLASATNQTIVVEGMISNSPEFQEIVLKLHYPNDSARMISGARVLLEHETGRKSEFSELGAGKYHPSGTLTIVEGSRYRLLIDMGDSVSIESNWQTAPLPLGIENGYFDAIPQIAVNDLGFDIQTNGFNYFVTTAPSVNENTYMRYDYQYGYQMEAPFRSTLCPDCNSCFILGKSKDFIKTGDILGGSDGQLKDFKVLFIPSNVEYSLVKTVRIIQFALTEKSYEYYRLIEQQKKLEGTIFDPPPAVFETSFKDLKNPARRIYGVFDLNAVTETSVTVRKGDADFRIDTFTEVCTERNGFGNPDRSKPECFDCKRKAGSTFNRPVWF